jgi:predicted Rossmann fold flavoprotein
MRSNHPRQEIATALAGFLPKRLAQTIAEGIEAPPPRIADFSDKLLSQVAAAVKQWRVRPNGTEGYRTAEVTLGGVDTSELSSKTFEARSVAGLYFIGEVVDVTGHLGGFNFQWAWSSGHAAGRHL